MMTVSCSSSRPVAPSLPGLPGHMCAAATRTRRSVLDAVLSAYDFTAIDEIVEIARPTGSVLGSILAAYPRVRGTIVGSAPVVELARVEIAGMSMAHRARAIVDTGALPPGADAYLMPHLLAGLDRVGMLTRLDRARDAMVRPWGRLLLLEPVLAVSQPAHIGRLAAKDRLVVTDGTALSADEFADLLTDAGFALTRVVPTRSPISVIEARPN